MTEPEIKLVYSVREAAAALGVGRSLIFALLADGSLESIRVGAKRRLIPAQAITAYIERQRQAAQAEAAAR